MYVSFSCGTHSLVLTAVAGGNYLPLLPLNISADRQCTGPLSEMYGRKRPLMVSWVLLMGESNDVRADVSLTVVYYHLAATVPSAFVDNIAVILVCAYRSIRNLNTILNLYSQILLRLCGCIRIEQVRHVAVLLRIGTDDPSAVVLVS